MADDQGSLDLPASAASAIPPPIDVKTLIGIVAKRHNVLLKADDPVFVLCTVLEEVSKNHLAILTAHVAQAQDAITATSIEQREASREIAERIVNEGGGFIAGRVMKAGQDMAPTITEAVVAGLAPVLAEARDAATAAKTARRDKHVALAAAAAAILAAVASAGLYAGSLAA